MCLCVCLPVSVFWPWQEMTLHDMYVEDGQHKEHLRQARVLVPSQCRCEAPHRVKDIRSEARISVSEMETPRSSSSLVSGTDTTRQGIAGLMSATKKVTKETNSDEGLSPPAFSNTKQEVQGLNLKNHQATLVNRRDDTTLSHQRFQEHTEFSTPEKRNTWKSLKAFLRERRSVDDSDTPAELLLINLYLSQIWPNSSCIVPSSLYNNMSNIIEELPHAFWQAGGTAEEQDVALLAGAIFAGVSRCRVHNVTAALQTGHLARLMVASLRAAIILKDHIMNASKVSLFSTVIVSYNIR